MVRPLKQRQIGRLNGYFFKPQGVPLRQLSETILRADEMEALKLHHLEELNQVQAAEKMNISQPTFARILSRAYKKITYAFINGQAIKIEQNK